MLGIPQLKNSDGPVKWFEACLRLISYSRKCKIIRFLLARNVNANYITTPIK